MAENSALNFQDLGKGQSDRNEEVTVSLGEVQQSLQAYSQLRRRAFFQSVDIQFQLPDGSVSEIERVAVGQVRCSV